ncbi:MAG TPA: hydroxyisourate hydrolase [Actinomycetes bacterium]|nr:hydroxyisourate hydrolase [Actinomycetes bacterium]
MSISTHVLDTTTGLPAVGLPVRLEGDGVLVEGVTDDDGRLSGLGPDAPGPGTYRLRFATWEWFLGQGRQAFYPEVVVTFAVTDPARHLHVPLLLSAYSYSTYRGS